MTSAAENNLRTCLELFKRHWLAFLFAQLAVVAAWVVLEIAVVAARWSGLPEVVYWPLWLCLHLAFFWVFCGLMAGIHRMALQAVDGGIPTCATAVSRLGRGKIYFVTALLYWAAVIGGLVLGVIPGIVMAVKWAPFRFLLAENSKAVLPSLHEAALLSTSHRWDIFRALAVSVILNLVGAVFLGVGLLITFPVTVILRANQFRSLQRQVGSLRVTSPMVDQSGH